MLSKLIKLEREIANAAGRVRGGRVHPRLKKRLTIAAFVRAMKRELTAVIALSRDYRLAITASTRQLMNTAIHGGSLARAQKRNAAPPLEHPLTTKPLTNRTSTVGQFLISACLGVVSICLAMILALFLQIHDLKIELAQTGTELATIKSRFVQLEKLAQQLSIKETTPAKKVQATHEPLIFSEADIKVIRQSIKVLPPKPGALQKFHVGDEFSDSTLAPIPESLVDQLPKLRGARFSIDLDGAIIIISAGSNRVDAVLSYN